MKLVTVVIPFLASLSIWIVCLVEVLKGNALEPFQLGNIVTAKTALGYTYLHVLVADLIVFLALCFFGFFEVRRFIEERSLLRKYRGDSRFARILHLDERSRGGYSDGGDGFDGD